MSTEHKQKIKEVYQKIAENKRLRDVCGRYGFYGEGDENVNRFFHWATLYDEETAKTLIFEGSPVLSTEINLWRDASEDSFLHILSRVNPNIVLAQLLIDFGVNVDKKDKKGYTALHLNVKFYKSINGNKNHLKMINVLLKNGANRDIKNRFGLTPIQVSLFHRKLEVAEEFLKEEDKLPNATEVDRKTRCRHLVKCLLRERNDWNFSDTNYSILLHFLLFENDDEIFEYVANSTKFDLNAINHKGSMLLHLVAQHGTPRMIRTLINLGADPNATEKQKCFEVETPLIAAIKSSRIENFYCLLDCGASATKIHASGVEISSPLPYAVCMKNLEMVEKLVMLGADVNAITFDCSPLFLACSRPLDLKCPWKLIWEVNTDDIKHRERIDDFTLNEKMVEFLLDHGADITAKHVSNRTALDQACRFGQIDIVKLLLSRGAKINDSTLHHAVREKNLAVVKLILEKGANVNYRCAADNDVDPTPRTPLECVLDFIDHDSNSKAIIELLMEYGVNFNVEDAERRETPLHLAFMSNKKNKFITGYKVKSRPATIKLLLSHNANVNALNSNALVPLHYALRNYTLMIKANIGGSSSNYLQPDLVDLSMDLLPHHHVLRNYSSITDESTKWKSYNRFKPDLVALIAFIAKMIENKEHVIDENLILLEDRSARLIYQDCVKELTLMKRNICESRNLSFFTILCKDIQYLGSVLKNEDIFQVLNSGEYKKLFPIYADYLEDRIQEATIRQRLVDLVIVLFQKHVHKISVELILNISKFLNLEAFKSFAKACFVDV